MKQETLVSSKGTTLRQAIRELESNNITEITKVMIYPDMCVTEYNRE